MDQSWSSFAASLLLQMPTFYFSPERHTLASALRPALEESTSEFVHCTLIHPLDEHIEVVAPDEATVRNALLTVKDQIRTARSVVSAAKDRRGSAADSTGREGCPSDPPA